MGLRARLAIAVFATITLVFVVQFLYYRVPWPPPDYSPCLRHVDSMQCRIMRKVPVDDLVQYAIMLGLGALLLPLSARWVLAPVRRLGAVVTQIGPQNLGYRVRPGRRGRDEIKRLGRALDTMMDRIAAGYEGQRTFAANASHELRTPLALQRTLIEVGMTEPLSPEQATLLAGQMLAANARNERLIEGLLVLSQADQGLSVRTPQTLDHIAAAIVGSHAATAAEADVKITTDLRPHDVPGDGILLERLVRNLVQNAIKYNHPGGTVHVTVNAGDAALTVRNTGPVVPESDVGRLFEPFTRLSTDRVDHSGGSGLGLAIARSIVRAHNGTITATPLTDGGLHVAVQLPAD